MADENDDPEYNPEKEFSFITHDYEIESNKKNDDGEPIADRIVLYTKSPNVGRKRVTVRPEVEKTEYHDGKKVTTTGKPTVSNLPEKFDKITEKLEDRELVQITATVTEIVPDDNDPYHAIVTNHTGTVKGRVLKGDEAEKFRDEFLRDSEKEEPEETI